MSLLDVISDFATGDAEPSPGAYAVAHQSGGSYVGGKWVDGPTTTASIVASVQPTNGRDLKILAEAGVTEESRKVFTESPLQTRRPGAEPDVVTIDGEPWVVHNVSRWEAFGDVFYVALVARRSQK